MLKPDQRADPASTAVAAELLAREGLLLDHGLWDEWLQLYLPDCIYWVPTWKSEDELVSDVTREVSLIYLDSRAGLQDRIVRVRSRKSVTAMPLPRTAHFVSNVHAVPGAQRGSIDAIASWQVHEFDPRGNTQHHLFGHYEVSLRQLAAQEGPVSDAAGPWRIARKKIVIRNDLYPSVIDFYSL